MKAIAIILCNARILMNLAAPTPQATEDQYLWQLPEISVKAPENAQQCLEDYIFEETGLRIQYQKKISALNTGMWNNQQEEVYYFTVPQNDFVDTPTTAFKYFIELNQHEQNLACMHGYFSAIEDWRLDKFRILQHYKDINPKCKKGQVLFTGSSLQENFPIERFVNEKYQEKKIVYNRGIGGYTTREMLLEMGPMAIDLKPKKVFINIGTNDLADPTLSLEQIMENYEKIICQIKKEVKGVKIYMMAYYPGNIDVAADYMVGTLKIRTNEKIAKANQMVKELAEKTKCKYIDLNYCIQDQDGKLRPEFSLEGLHINEDAYRAIFPEIEKYIWE